MQIKPSCCYMVTRRRYTNIEIWLNSSLQYWYHTDTPISIFFFFTLRSIFNVAHGHIIWGRNCKFFCMRIAEAVCKNENQSFRNFWLYKCFKTICWLNTVSCLIALNKWKRDKLLVFRVRLPIYSICGH